MTADAAAATGAPTLVVAEVFGPTVQGEGPSAGRRAGFIRLAGCNLHCSWCTVPGVMILRPDFTWTPVELLQPGDKVIGRTAPERGRHGRLVESAVLATTRRDAPLIRVNGNLTCSADTRVWVSRNRNAHTGWREFTRSIGLDCTFLAEPIKRDHAEYERGYVAGMADGDGSFWTLRTRRQSPVRRFRLALSDQRLLDRTRRYASRAGFILRSGWHGHRGFKGDGTMPCLWLTVGAEAERFEQWVEEDLDSESWAWGYLAGMFDAEGSLARQGQLRISQYAGSPDGRRVYERTAAAAARCGFEVVRENKGILLRTGRGALWRFLTGAVPAKQSSLANGLNRAPNNARTVLAVEDAGHGEVVSLTTTTGNYIAEGWLVHNCDSAFTWDASRFNLREEATRTPVTDIVARALAGTPELVVITGGEPLLHRSQPGWLPLLDALTAAGADIEIETNGTQAPDQVTIDRVTRFNVSPKLAHAGDPEAARIRPLALRALDATGKAVFKFVCRSPGDVAEAARIAESVGIPAHRVWVMPEGVTVAAITSGLGQLADVAVAAGFNVTTRLHVLAWGDERGR